MSLARWFASWNDINATTAKSVVTAIMQFIAFLVLVIVWAVGMIVQLRAWKSGDVDFHTEFLYLLLGWLSALSGINLAGLGIKRSTDVDYALAKNAGKPAQVTVSGDNPQVTATMPVPDGAAAPAMPAFRRPTRRSQQVAAQQEPPAPVRDATAIAGPRSVVTDHDQGIL